MFLSCSLTILSLANNHCWGFSVQKDVHFLYQHKITLLMIYNITIFKKRSKFLHFLRLHTLLSLGTGDVYDVNLFFSNLVCFSTS